MRRLLVIIAVGMLAGQVQAGLAMRGLAAVRANMSKAPTDYDHYWHPSKFLDSDDHVGSLDGTMYGGLDESSEGWAMGTDNAKYIALDGPISNSTSYTVSCWIKPDIDEMNLNQYGGWIVSDRTQTPNDFQLYYNKSGYYRCSAWDSSGVSVSEINTNYYDDAWQHLCMVVDYGNSTIELFVNGVSDGATELTITPQNASTTNAAFAVGSWGASPGGSQTKYRGSMDNVKIWATRALSESEVEALYKKGRTK